MITGWYVKDGQACAKGRTEEARMTEPGEEMGSGCLARGGDACDGQQQEGRKRHSGQTGRRKVHGELCPRGAGWKIKTAGSSGELGQTGER